MTGERGRRVAQYLQKVGRETIRRLFVSHELKPWREKMWCVTTLDRDYIERMEDVLEVLSQPPKPIKPGQPARRDYEYARSGTANVFCIVEPTAARHQTYATPNRTALQFADAPNGSP